MLYVKKWVLGPVATNTYLVGDQETKELVVIDPAWDGGFIGAQIKEGGWRLAAVWLTHAHFDHFAGLADLLESADQKSADFFVGMHKKDLPLWKVKGGAVMFGVSVKSAPKPDHLFEDGEELQLGSYRFTVRYTPGHSAGHVVFHCASEKVLFSGDLIFNQGIGRTDLLGGSYKTLIQSIESHVLPLPDETVIYSGHGPETTVGAERVGNPFLQ